MYKVNDFLLFKTKQPHVHLNRMFGHNNLTYDDFDEEEYTGVVEGVLDGFGYTMTTLSPLEGFFCVISEYDIIRQLEPEEVAQLEKKSTLQRHN